MSTIRAFIAIELSNAARAVLTEVNEALAQQAPRQAVRWVNPERMHLTLRFLGDTPVEKVADLKTVLDDAAKHVEPFVMTLDSLGCFPNERKPRVIWVGVMGDVAQAETLRASIDRMLEPLGWEMERRPFRAHLTLGRVKEQRRELRLPWGKRVAPAEIPVHEIVLFESRLGADGSRYIAKHRSRLGRPAAH